MLIDLLLFVLAGILAAPFMLIAGAGDLLGSLPFTRDLFADRVPLLKRFKYPAALVVFLLFAASAAVVLLQGFLSFAIYGALLAAAGLTTALTVKRERKTIRKLLGSEGQTPLKPPES
jgi:hypothetical protein